MLRIAEKGNCCFDLRLQFPHLYFAALSAGSGTESLPELPLAQTPVNWYNISRKLCNGGDSNEQFL